MDTNIVKQFVEKILKYISETICTVYFAETIVAFCVKHIRHKIYMHW